jgi:hypothetical protein
MYGEIDELFAEKSNRDERFRALLLMHPTTRFGRYSVRNQQLHPMYVEDRKETMAGRDRGFGNTAYQSFFGVLYGVREARRD